MNGIIETYRYELIFASLLFILLITILIVNISNSIKIKKLNSKYDTFMKDVDGHNVEVLIQKCINDTVEVKERSRDIENRINTIERNVMQCIQKVGVVRFNAFDNVGSDLSFSVALLDTYDNGIVLSGIYSRDNSLNYAKPIISGKSKYALSAEEMQAVEIARKTGREIIYNTFKV